MTTKLKNKWIALEEKYHNLLKEKVAQHNLKNTSSPLHPAISSQMTFCSDGVQIRRYVNPDFKSGISVKAYKKNLAEMKFVEEFRIESQRELNIPLIQYGKEEFGRFNAEKIAESDFKEIKGQLV